MINPLEITPLKESFNGIYRATVVDNAGTGGKVQVRVLPMMEGASESDLPWAIPAMPVPLANKGLYGLPAIGSTVWVFFDGGDIYSPVYFAGAPSGTEWPAEVVDGMFQLTTPGGQIVKIDDTDGSLTIEVTGDISITASGNVTVQGTQIDLN